MWTSLVFEKEHNAIVENWFGVVKNKILNGNLHNKCSRFIRQLRNYTINEYRELVYDIDRNRCATKRRHNKADLVENWGKRQKKHTII